MDNSRPKISRGNPYIGYEKVKLIVMIPSLLWPEAVMARQKFGFRQFLKALFHGKSHSKIVEFEDEGYEVVD